MFVLFVVSQAFAEAAAGEVLAARSMIRSKSACFCGPTPRFNVSSNVLLCDDLTMRRHQTMLPTIAVSQLFICCRCSYCPKSGASKVVQCTVGSGLACWRAQGKHRLEIGCLRDGMLDNEAV